MYFASYNVTSHYDEKTWNIKCNKTLVISRELLESREIINNNFNSS